MFKLSIHYPLLGDIEVLLGAASLNNQNLCPKINIAHRIFAPPLEMLLVIREKDDHALS
jgi:hypothetical protein